MTTIPKETPMTKTQDKAMTSDKQELPDDLMCEILKFTNVNEAHVIAVLGIAKMCGYELVRADRHEDIKAVDTHVCDEECGGAINMRHCDKAQAVDVGALKKDYCTCRDCQVWNSCIDHLAAHGHIAGRLPFIEKLNEFLENNQNAVQPDKGPHIEAATEYAKRMEGE